MKTKNQNEFEDLAKKRGNYFRSCGMANRLDLVSV
jgi:hypothetical protein